MLVVLEDMCKEAGVVICDATKAMAYIRAKAMDLGKVEVEDEIKYDTAVKDNDGWEGSRCSEE